LGSSIPTRHQKKRKEIIPLKNYGEKSYSFFLISTASKEYIPHPINPRMIPIFVVIGTMMSEDVSLGYENTDKTRVELTFDDN
jgi:hypothetical protein